METFPWRLTRPNSRRWSCCLCISPIRVVQARVRKTGTERFGSSSIKFSSSLSAPEVVASPSAIISSCALAANISTPATSFTGQVLLGPKSRARVLQTDSHDYCRRDHMSAEPFRDNHLQLHNFTNLGLFAFLGGFCFFIFFPSVQESQRCLFWIPPHSCDL